GAYVDMSNTSSSVVIHAPNATIVHEGDGDRHHVIEVPEVSRNDVPDFLKDLPLPVINSPATARAFVDIPFYYVVTASNSPTSYGASGLPAGLVLNSSTGAISGKPTVTGAFEVELSATNEHGSTTKSLNLWVGDP